MKRRLLDFWKSGWIAIIPVVILFYVFSALFALIQLMTLPLFDSNFLNLLVNSLLLLVVAPTLFGLLLSWSWPRQLALSLLGRLPLVGIIAKFIFKRKNQLSKKQRNRMAVRVEISPGSGRWLTGAIVREWRAPWNLRDPNSEETDWCKVLAWTFPVSFTGYAVDVHKVGVVFLDITVETALLDAAGFYLSDQEQEKDKDE